MRIKLFLYEAVCIHRRSGRLCHSCFFHLAKAAFFATSLRSLAVIVLSLCLPPIFPPFLPSSDINKDICAFVGNCSPVDSSTSLWANWFTSEVCFLFVLRMPDYGMLKPFLQA